jgi:AcrR family transcriptional regulator
MRKSTKRDREATERRILEATGRILARHGFRGLGVNAIAREARADKVLVYRYFGGLPGLLEAYAQSTDFWPSADELAPRDPSADPAALASAMLSGLVRALRSRPATQEILAWELVEPSPLAERTAEVRERAGVELMAKLPAELPPGVDLPAVAALLTAGLTYLVLRSRTTRAWLGVPLQDAATFQRLERAAETVVRALLPSQHGNSRPRSTRARAPKRRNRGNP